MKPSLLFLFCLSNLVILTPRIDAQAPAPAPTQAPEVTSTPAANAAIVPFGNVVQGYTLAFSDEFDGTTLDTSKWTYRTDSKMWSAQVADNVSVANGNLVIAVKKEHVKKESYTGGGIISKQAFEYGYYEARFKVPPGSGWHTSFWAAAYNDTNTKVAGTQEIDICEQDSVKTSKYSAGVIGWGNRGKGFGRKYIATPDLAADFHVWGCEFTPTTVNFFFDGKLTHQTDATKFKHGPQNIWLTAIASGLGGTRYVDNKRLPAAAQFDYVRFFAPATPQK
jgi:beta-glucanase (GH16 family)